MSVEAGWMSGIVLENGAESVASVIGKNPLASRT